VTKKFKQYKMTFCGIKNAKNTQCKNKAADGFFIQEVAVCKHHYGNHMIELKQVELDALNPPKKEVEPIEIVPCKCKTKEGTKDEKPCQNKASALYDGMCTTHYNAHQKKLNKASVPIEEPKMYSPCKQIIKDPKEGSKQCSQLEADNCDGYCKRHHNLKLKTEKEAEEKLVKQTEAAEKLAASELASSAYKEALNAAIDAANSEKKPTKKREFKVKEKPKDTLESAVKDLIENTDELLLKGAPPLQSFDSNDNVFSNVEIPTDF
jgi:hypothetical protein